MKLIKGQLTIEVLDNVLVSDHFNDCIKEHILQTIIYKNKIVKYHEAIKSYI